MLSRLGDVLHMRTDRLAAWGRPGRDPSVLPTRTKSKKRRCSSGIRLTTSSIISFWVSSSSRSDTGSAVIPSNPRALRHLIAKDALLCQAEKINLIRTSSDAGRCRSSYGIESTSSRTCCAVIKYARELISNNVPLPKIAGDFPGCSMTIGIEHCARNCRTASSSNCDHRSPRFRTAGLNSTDHIDRTNHNTYEQPLRVELQTNTRCGDIRRMVCRCRGSGMYIRATHRVPFAENSSGTMECNWGK